MAKYAPVGRIRYNAKERPLQKAEEPIVEFLEHGLRYTIKQLEVANKANKFGSCSILQNQAILLRDTIDSIRAGYHDATHPNRVIDPEERAHYVYNQIAIFVK
jgi:hypothetical protein